MLRYISFVLGLITNALACPMLELTPRQASCGSFNYTQQGRDWANQCSDWSQCGIGRQQSPINLPAGQFASTHAPTIDLRGATSLQGQLYNRGFGLEWAPNAGAVVPRLRFDGGSYPLLQWHTHTPTSEHSIGGQRTRAEIHFVFGNPGNVRAVAGLTLTNGGESPFFNEIFRQVDQLPTLGSDTRLPVTFVYQALANLPNYFANYWTYRGSLTTPPCSQGIRWFVAGRAHTASAAQLRRLEAVSSNSIRALQPVQNQQVNV